MKSIIFITIGFLQFMNCQGQYLSEEQAIINQVDSIRKRFHIPGLTFGVATGDTTLLLGALGIREINTKDSITIHDMFHIASLGKGFTSFIAGRLIDEGKIKWEHVFP